MILEFILGVGVGAGVLSLWKKTKARKGRRIPHKWPLKSRPLVSSSERRIWIWLSKVMFDQQVLIKLPVTRFTSPSTTGTAEDWYQLLNGVYCTFTVCGMDGRILGCVDIQHDHGRAQSNQALKHSLLSQCGIRYWVLDPSNLPHLTQIRAGLLGEIADASRARDHLETRFNDGRENLKATITKQRSHHLGSEQPELPIGKKPHTEESRLASEWELNSFVTPLDSRSVPLTK